MRTGYLTRMAALQAVTLPLDADARQLVEMAYRELAEAEDSAARDRRLGYAYDYALLAAALVNLVSGDVSADAVYKFAERVENAGDAAARQDFAELDYLDEAFGFVVDFADLLAEGSAR